MRRQGAAAIVALIIALVAGAPKASAGRGTEALRLLPDDTRIVVVVDVKRARTSPLFQTAFDLATDKAPWLERLDVDKQVDTIVAGSAGFATSRGVIILEGKLDKLVPAIEKRATSSATHNGITYWTTEHGEVSVVDKRIIVTHLGGMTAALDRARDKRRKMPANIQRVIAATTANAAIVGGVVPDDTMRKDIAAELGAEATLVTGSIGVGARVAFEGRFQFSDAPSATKAGAVFEKTIQESRDRLEVLIGKDLADSIAVDTDDTVTRVSATMNADEVSRTVSMARLFL
jgi:hypothetical protein